ncbi:MAG: UDP-N-acetylmuramoyl-L-alanine--D-glutamate ligase, partial [Calditrichaeota bacterium]
MTTEQRIKDRNIGIIGMARSGIAAAVLAESIGGKPFVSDSKSADLLATEIERLNTAGIPYEFDGHSERLLASDYLVVSPGVPLTIPILKEAREKGIPVFSEIEFASWCCKGKIIAITGSNGKTTTTTLIGEIFATAGFDTYVCGNIGFPFAEIVSKIPEKGIAIVEVSNFQLETISDFKPDAALILNLTPDHLDRHGSFENYIKAKLRITENQDQSDYLVLNFDDKVTSEQKIESNADIHYFSTGTNAKADTTVLEESLFYRGEKIIDTA